MVNTLFLGMIGMPQVLLIIGALVLLFGAKKIPELMKGVGKGIREFKDATKDKDTDPSDKDDKKSGSAS